jgi:PAS domain S-box-containing protein
MADAVPILISYVDREERYRFVNRAYERWFAVDRAEIEGRTMREVLGGEAYSRLQSHIHRALAGETVTYAGEVNYQGAGLRYIEAQYVPDIARNGEIPGFYVLVTDISDRRAAATELERMLAGERRRGALLDLGQKLRDEADPTMIAQIAARTLAEQLGVARAGYADMDLEVDVADIVADDGLAHGGVVPMTGLQLRLDDFGPSMSADMRAGRTVVVGDVALDPRTHEPDALEAYAGLGVRSFVTVSLIKTARLSAYLFLAPRRAAHLSARRDRLSRRRRRADLDLQRARPLGLGPQARRGDRAPADPRGRSPRQERIGRGPVPGPADPVRGQGPVRPGAVGPHRLAGARPQPAVERPLERRRPARPAAAGAGSLWRRQHRAASRC